MKVADIVYSSFFRLLTGVETSATLPHQIITYQSSNYLFRRTFSRQPVCRERASIFSRRGRRGAEIQCFVGASRLGCCKHAKISGCFASPGARRGLAPELNDQRSRIKDQRSIIKDQRSRIND